MIVTLPDEAVVAQRSARTGLVADRPETAGPAATSQGSEVPATHDVARGRLQTLLNVTLDCVRGRYDR